MSAVLYIFLKVKVWGSPLRRGNTRVCLGEFNFLENHTKGRLTGKKMIAKRRKTTHRYLRSSKQYKWWYFKCIDCFERNSTTLFTTVWPSFSCYYWSFIFGLWIPWLYMGLWTLCYDSGWSSRSLFFFGVAFVCHSLQV